MKTNRVNIPLFLARMPALGASFFCCIWCLAPTAVSEAAPHKNASPLRERLLMDPGWRFRLGDPVDAGQTFEYSEAKDLAKTRVEDMRWEAGPTADPLDAAGANLGANVSYVQPAYADKAWRQLDLPHDWAVELPFDPEANASHGFKQLDKAGGTAVGWYRRTFGLPADDRGRTIWVEFDGVFRNSLVWLNGHCLGRNVSGYGSSYYDLTRYANFGGSNVLVVRVDASRTEGWFYEGAGIYRHVWLVKVGPVHVAHWGTYVTSQLEGKNASVTAETRVSNDTAGDTGCALVSTILDEEGRAVTEAEEPAITIPAHGDQVVRQQLTVRNARLWSLETPHLYRLVTMLKKDGVKADSYETPFGIRTIRFDAEKGFFLNGRHVEIQGTCNHQDHAGVGSALPDRLQYFRVEKLKEMGCNAYRTSHNPPTPELLEACDQLGMLVMDENRRMDTMPQTLGELERLIQRDRNHPSIMIWSLGNEEKFIQGTDEGARVAEVMKEAAHRLDPTRPVTVAMNAGWGGGFSKVVDVMGCNYHTGNIERLRTNHTAQPLIGSEVASTETTRGIYADDAARGYVSAYGERGVSKPWGWWPYFADHPFAEGGFVWTGFDYRGEPTPYKWPDISSHFGIMDMCGFPKDIYYYYQAWWTDKPVLHLAPHWNWAGREGQEIKVRCFGNCKTVELFLNDKSLGRQAMEPNGYLDWQVPYAPGTLLAVGRDGDRPVAESKVETTGEAAG